MFMLHIAMVEKWKIVAIVQAIFALAPQHIGGNHLQKANLSCTAKKPIPMPAKAEKHLLVKKLAGPYAKMVVHAAKKAHVAPRLVAAIVHVENGGNFNGSTHRVSSAGAIGVMQLMPNTAWNFLHVNPWSAQQNIDGGARYVHYLLKIFHNNVRLAVMAYNAGPTAIAHGYRPRQAVYYANKVLEEARI